MGEGGCKEELSEVVEHYDFNVGLPYTKITYKQKRLLRLRITANAFACFQYLSAAMAKIFKHVDETERRLVRNMLKAKLAWKLIQLDRSIDKSIPRLLYRSIRQSRVSRSLERSLARYIARPTDSSVPRSTAQSVDRSFD